MVCLLLRARAGEDQEDGGELREESVRQVMRRNTLQYTHFRGNNRDSPIDARSVLQTVRNSQSCMLYRAANGVAHAGSGSMHGR